MLKIVQEFIQRENRRATLGVSTPGGRRTALLNTIVFARDGTARNKRFRLII